MPYRDIEKRRAARRQSDAKRRATPQVDLGDLPDVPSEDQLLRLLGVRARQGHVPAIRLLLSWYRERKKADVIVDAEVAELIQLGERRGFARVDELAALRRSQTRETVA